MSLARRLGLVTLTAALGALAGCDVNEYCVDCPTGDDGGAIDGNRNDGGVDADPTRPDACIITGAEACNGLDDDCDGTTDEDIATVGDDCESTAGACAGGVIECSGGVLGCSAPPSPEICDQVDNDCDGVVDDGNPEGGNRCGTDAGDCVAGVEVCVDGVIDCVGESGTVDGVPETCDGRDNDCDGVFDDGIPTQGPCGDSDGVCEPGVRTCVGGTIQCVGGSGPTFELCDAIDQDCDGLDFNGYDLDNDIRNCGACGTSCIDTIDNASERCLGGDCVIAACDANFHDDPDIAGPDCLYACTFAGPNEACNGDDDDCDGDVDENLPPAPGICDTDGECAGATVECNGALGWDCDYSTAGDVSLTDGNLSPETECDNLDNDCDTRIDESHPTKGDDCDGPGTGICQDFGHQQCNLAAQLGPTTCVLDDLSPVNPGDQVETCDNEDDDCNGVIDNGYRNGANQAWVDIGGGRQIMKYEASRPDAAHPDNPPGSQGTVNGTYACSQPGVKPWTMIDQPDAEAVCTAMGARLCSEQEWHRACSVTSVRTCTSANVCTAFTYPIAQPTTDNGFMYIEAESFQTVTPRTSGGVTRTWVPDYTGGYSGISALRASPNTTTCTPQNPTPSCSGGADVSTNNALAQAPRLDFTVTFTATTPNHYVWVRMFSPNDSDDTVHVGIAAAPGTPQQSLVSVNGAWNWRRTGAISVSPGLRTVSIYMQDDGTRIDAIAITRSNSNTAPTNAAAASNGGDWSFATAADTYVGSTCNGDDNDSDGVPGNGDQDSILFTGAKASCNAAWPGGSGGGVFDMSGNVKEWAAQRLDAQNPIRGGASNNDRNGISCSNAFVLANDTFVFDNLGFRCCK